MNVKQVKPTFTLIVSQQEMRLLVVAADMLGSPMSDTPSFPLSSEQRDLFDGLYSALTGLEGMDEDTLDTLKALGIVAKEAAE